MWNAAARGEPLGLKGNLVEFTCQWQSNEYSHIIVGMTVSIYMSLVLYSPLYVLYIYK